MKVVCESCQAKYQVPDERVAGKKLKIRCKRCGATVLIRGDLAQGAAAATAAAAATNGAQSAPPASKAPTPAPEVAQIEWHVSLDGEAHGPFETEELRLWLSTQPGGWDSHVWREGFPDWLEARVCAELGAPPLDEDSAPPEPTVVNPMHDDEAPTQTFESVAVMAAPLMAQAAASRRSSSSRRDSHSSSIRTRTASGNGSSPRMTAPDPSTFGHRDDSVLFSSRNLQSMTSSAPSYTPGPNPGFAGGEGSGLIDIRALASLARQSQPHLAPIAAAESGGYPMPSSPMSYGNDEADEARSALMNQAAFGRIDSLAPVSNTTQTSNVAVPLAILGGCALVAAAVFAAILIARPSRPSQPVAVTAPVTQEQDSLAAAAQPVNPTPDQNENEQPASAETAPAVAAEPAPTAARVEEAAADTVAAGKVRRQPHSPRTASDEKKSSSPEEKTKPKKEEKSQPPSLDEVMLAEKAKPAPKPVAVAAAPEAAKPEPPKGGTDIDTLLGGKPTPKHAGKSPSIDDLLEGAVDKNAPKTQPKAAAAVAAAPAEPSGEAGSDMPETPSRDETLAAMRGVESAVRACAAGQSITGTAQVQMTVSGTTGRVTTATVDGITGAVGSCIARAVRNAKFGRFTKPSFAIKYPYRF